MGHILEADPARFGEILKDARQGLGLSQAQIAAEIGVTPQAVSQWERGTSSPDLENLRALAKALGVASTPAELAQVQQDVTRIPRDQLQGRSDFPIYVSAEGGPGQIIVTPEEVDWMPRPAPLANVRGAYGLIVTGDSMEPEYRHGDTALVNPHLPAVGGEVYVFYAEKQGEARATIKHLRRAAVDKWHVSQHNPPDGQPKEFTLPRREWQWAHRVLGKYSRR